MMRFPFSMYHLTFSNLSGKGNFCKRRSRRHMSETLPQAYTYVIHTYLFELDLPFDQYFDSWLLKRRFLYLKRQCKVDVRMYTFNILSSWTINQSKDGRRGYPHSVPSPRSSPRWLILILDIAKH